MRQKVVDALTPILQLDARAQSDLLARLAVPDSHYLVVDHEISEAQSTAVRNVIAAQNLPGLVLEPHAVRLYPNPGGAPGTTLASQLIGFVTAEAIRQLRHRAEVRLHPGGQAEAPLGAARQCRPDLAEHRPGDRPGSKRQDIHLTIDASLQLQLEKELYAAWTADTAKSASA